MKIQASFLYGWRDSYARMIEDAKAGIAEALFKDMPPVPIPENPSDKNLIRRGLSAAFKEIDDDFWREFDIKDATSWVTAEKLSKAWVKEHPECAPKHNGLNAMQAKLSLFSFTAEKCTDKWLLRVLEDFRGIYAKDPGMCDYDAMIEFMTLEDLMQNKEDPEVFDAIPREDCEALDLRLSKNLKPWLERYETAVRKGPDAPITEMESDDITVDYTHDYPERVTLGADGAYRWRYDRDRQGGHVPARVYWQNSKVIILICVILVVLFSAPLAAMGYWSEMREYGLNPYAMFAACLLGFCGLVLLPTNLFCFFHYRRKSFRYTMTEEGLWFSTTPRTLRTGKKDADPDLLFRQRLRVISFYPENHLILLGRMGEPLFVPPEDYKMVRGFILKYINPTTKIIEG